MLSPKRAPEETLPANLTPFLPDEELESRRLERVQGWALLFAAVVAVALPLYWLHEPTRQSESANYFDKNAVERGEVLFSNPTMPQVRLRAVAAVRELPRREGRRAARCRYLVERRAGRSGRRRRSTPMLLRFTEDPGCVNVDDRDRR